VIKVGQPYPVSSPPLIGGRGRCFLEGRQPLFFNILPLIIGRYSYHGEGERGGEVDKKSPDYAKIIK